MYNEVEKAVFRPKVSVTVAELLEIDRSTTQSLWRLPDIHLPEPIHTSHFLFFLALHSSNQGTLFVCTQTKT